MKVPQGKQKELAPEGAHQAILAQILDLGTQASANPKFKDSRRVLLGFELLGIKTEEGDAFIIFKNYNFTNNEKSSLMKDVKAWMGVKTTDFDLDDFLGKAALVSITHSEATDGNIYANIENISALPKGMKVGKPATPFKTLYLEPGEFDQATFDDLGEKLRAKIAGTKEYASCIEAIKKPASKKSAAAVAPKAKAPVKKK